jgi:hypothetical protein
MQVITERLVEIRELLLCSARAFNVMIGVHSSAVTMMSLLRFIIFIKSSMIFEFAVYATQWRSVRIVSGLPGAQSAGSI